jgi:hypothetical protein
MKQKLIQLTLRLVLLLLHITVYVVTTYHVTAIMSEPIGAELFFGVVLGTALLLVTVIFHTISFIKTINRL